MGNADVDVHRLQYRNGLVDEYAVRLREWNVADHAPDANLHVVVYDVIIPS